MGKQVLNLASYNIKELADKRNDQGPHDGYLQNHDIGSCRPPGFFCTMCVHLLSRIRRDKQFPMADVHMELERDIADSMLRLDLATRKYSRQFLVLYLHLQSMGTLLLSTPVSVFCPEGVLKFRAVSFTGSGIITSGVSGVLLSITKERRNCRRLLAKTFLVTMSPWVALRRTAPWSSFQHP
jgi:hypothetical protein